MNKKFVATLLTITTVIIVGTTHTVLGSEQKQASLVSGIARTEIIQEKINTNKKNLQLILQAKEELSIAKERLDDESLNNANEKINNVPPFIRKLFTTELNTLTEKKLAKEEQKRIEEEEKQALAVEKQAEQAIKEEKQKEQVAQVKKEAAQTSTSKNQAATPKQAKTESKEEQTPSVSKPETTIDQPASQKKDVVKTETKVETNNNDQTKKEPSNGNIGKDFKKVSEGEIKDHSGFGSSGRTYEAWEFVWDE